MPFISASLMTRFWRSIARKASLCCFHLDFFPPAPPTGVSLCDDAALPRRPPAPKARPPSLSSDALLALLLARPSGARPPPRPAPTGVRWLGLASASAPGRGSCLAYLAASVPSTRCFLESNTLRFFTNTFWQTCRPPPKRADQTPAGAPLLHQPSKPLTLLCTTKARSLKRRPHTGQGVRVASSTTGTASAAEGPDEGIRGGGGLRGVSTSCGDWKPPSGVESVHLDR
jgi:hypothetical protein